MNLLKRSFAAALFLAAISAGSLQAQQAADFPTAFGPNNAGTEFFFSCPANWDLPGSTDYYVRIYITSTTATEVEVWTGPNLKQTVTTIPYGIVTVNLTPAEAQPVVRGDQPPVPNDAPYANKAVRIVSDEPVIAYVMNRTTYTSDGMLLLPTSALGQEYIVGSYGAVIGVSQELPSQFVITAPYDNTQVTITTPHRTPNHTAGETYTVTLNRGDVYSAMTVGYNGDMSGAIIKADKPVAVTAGQACTYIPNLLNFCCCDHITEMMFPTQSWGKLYHGIPFSTRLKGDFYRVFSKEENTKVFINGEEYATLSETGGEEGLGWFEYRALGRLGVEFSADKPIAVFQYNTSQAYDDVQSDPFYLELTPMEQYGKEIVFSTPNNDFPKNYLSVATDSANYYEIEIAESNGNTWRKLSSLPNAAVPQKYATRIDGKAYLGNSVQIGPGVYKLRAPAAFAGYLYGFSSYDSYGYAVAAFTEDLTIDDTTPPTIIRAPSSCDGSVVGTVSSQARSGSRLAPLSKVYLNPAQSSNFRLELPGFQPGLSPTAEYRLVPVDPAQSAAAVIYAADMAGNITATSASYQGGSAVASTLKGNDIIFEAATVGAPSTRTVSVVNNGDASVTISSISLADGTRGFRLLGPNAPLTIEAKGSINVEVEFSPIALGVYTDRVLLGADCGVVLDMPVQGSADHTLAVPGTLPGSTLGSAVVAPNPVRGDQATVGFTMQQKGAVTVIVVDAAGRELRRAADARMMEQGEQSMKLDLAGLPSGTYFVRISSMGQTAITSLVVAR